MTNLVGGWAGARTGLNRTLLAGLALQIVALVALTFHDPSWVEWASVAFVMAAQALSGIAKDLTKMSSKSAVKFLAGDAHGALFRLVAILTGSKNALKGVGFFLGAALLAWVGYDAALWGMAALIAVALVAVAVLLDEDIGRSKRKPRAAFRAVAVDGDQPPVGRPLLPVRFARHLVRRGAPGVPRRGARLVVRRHRCVHGRLGDRLRRDPGCGATAAAPIERRRARRGRRRTDLGAAARRRVGRDRRGRRARRRGHRHRGRAGCSCSAWCSPSTRHCTRT